MIHIFSFKIGPVASADTAAITAARSFGATTTV